jgi:hypothetical protein
MALKDQLTKDEADTLQWLMVSEPLRRTDVPARDLIAFTSLCHRGLIALGKRGWVVNWTHIPRKDP